MSQLRPKIKPLLIMLLAAALLFSLVGPARAQDGDTDGDTVESQDEPESCTAHPVVAQLVSDMEDEEVEDACNLVLGYIDSGVGVGQIMKAWYLSQALPGYGPDPSEESTGDDPAVDDNEIDLQNWEDLLLWHLEGQGWGQVMFAYRFADALAQQAPENSTTTTPTAEELLALKTVDGLGWGQIAKAQAVADAAGVSLDEVVTDIQNEMGWGEIREKHNLEPGRPPWAGPPPWANGNPNRNDVDGESLENGDESSGSGAPAFSGPPGQNRGNGKGPGKGKGGGNGNAYGHNK